MTTHPNGCGGEIMTLEAQERQSVIKGCRARLRRELINELTARTPAMGVIETKASKKAIRDGVRQWRETMVERWETLPAPSKDEYKAAIIETINQTVKQAADQTIAAFDRNAAADEIKEILIGKLIALSNADFQQTVDFANEVRRQKGLLLYTDDGLNRLVEEFAESHAPMVTMSKQMYESDLGEEIDNCVAKDSYKFSPLGSQGYELLGTSTIELANRVRELIAAKPEWSYAEYLMADTGESVKDYAKRLQLDEMISNLIADVLPDPDQVLFEKLNQMLKQAHAEQQLTDVNEISIGWIYGNRDRAWRMAADYQTFTALLGGERVLPKFKDADQTDLWVRLEQLVKDEYQTFRAMYHADDEHLDARYCNEKMYEVVRQLADNCDPNEWDAFQKTLTGTDLIAANALGYFQANSLFVDQKRLETIKKRFYGTTIPTIKREMEDYIAKRVNERFHPQTPKQYQTFYDIIENVQRSFESGLRLEANSAKLQEQLPFKSIDELKGMLLDTEKQHADERIKYGDTKFARTIREDLLAVIQDLPIAPMNERLLETWASALGNDDLIDVNVAGIKSSLQKALNDLAKVSKDDDIDAKERIFKGLLKSVTTDAEHARGIKMADDDLERCVVTQAENDVWKTFWPKFRQLNGAMAVAASRFVSENHDAMLECWLNSFNDSLHAQIIPIYQRRLATMLNDQMSSEQLKQASEAVLQGSFYNHPIELLANAARQWRGNALYIKKMLPAVTARLLKQGRYLIGIFLEEDGLTGSYNFDGIITKAIQERFDMADLLWVVDNYSGTELMQTVVEKTAGMIAWRRVYDGMVKPDLLRRFKRQYLEKLSDQGVNDANARTCAALLSEQDLLPLKRALDGQDDLLKPLMRLDYVPRETGDDDMDEQRILEQAYEKAMREYEDERYFDEDWWNSTYDARLSALIDNGDASQAQRYLNGEIIFKELLDVSDDVIVPKEVAEQIKQKLTEKLTDAIGERLDDWASTATGGLILNDEGDQIKLNETWLKLKHGLVDYIDKTMPSDAEIDDLAVICDENKGDPGEMASLQLEQLHLPDDADFERDNAESLTSQFHEWLGENVVEPDAETMALISRVPLRSALQAGKLAPLGQQNPLLK